MNPKKPKMGRPRRTKKASEKRLVARCSASEYADAERAAKQEGVQLSEFIRASVAEHARIALNGAKK